MFCEKMIRVKKFPDFIRAKMPRNILSYKDWGFNKFIFSL